MDARSARAAGARGSGVAASSRTVGTACTAARAPAGSSIPCSRRMPRSALIRAVRVVIHCSRTRCKATSACCSTRLTGHARDLARPHGLEDRFGIRAIGLVPAHVRAHVGRRAPASRGARALARPVPSSAPCRRLPSRRASAPSGGGTERTACDSGAAVRRCASAHPRSPVRRRSLRGPRPLS